MEKNWANTSINWLSQNGWSRILLGAMLVALAMVCAPVARAGGVVSSCDETSLLTAVSGGGMVKFTCSGTITLTATITISADTTIDGTGQNVTISGGNAVLVLSVPSGVKLNLNKITIANGNGGGIRNFGSLSVTNSTFSSNTAPSGGGIQNVGATATVNNTTFSGNSASDGGAIFNFNYATMTVTNSTFTGNSATSIGGGILSQNSILTVANSTFSGNTAPNGVGGAIFYFDFYDELDVTNSTFSGNSAVQGGAILFIVNEFQFRNNIFANSPSGGNCNSPGGGTFYGNVNLDTDGTCGPPFTKSSDPGLGPLQNNGGPTQTMAISTASPAFAGANPANCPATDQRGVLRPQFMACDIGAYEFATANSLLTAVRNNILTLIPTGNQHDQTTLTAVASALTAALNSHNWRGTDGNHLNPSEGEDVFELLVERVSAPLTQLLKASPPSAIPAQTLQTLLNNVTLAGRTLATVAISDAAGGDPTKLAKANALLAKGDADAAAGRYISALVNYEIAWALLQRDT